MSQELELAYEDKESIIKQFEAIQNSYLMALKTDEFRSQKIRKVYESIVDSSAEEVTSLKMLETINSFIKEVKENLKGIEGMAFEEISTTKEIFIKKLRKMNSNFNKLEHLVVKLKNTISDLKASNKKKANSQNLDQKKLEEKIKKSYFHYDLASA